MLESVFRALHGAAILLLPFFAVVLALILIVTWVLRLRDRRPRFATTRNPKNDLTNTMIMFQTMRDILEQQKDVARQLNVSLDNKVKYIRKVVETAVADLQEMRETARRLAGELARTKAELAALQAEVAQAEGNVQEAAHGEAVSPSPALLDEPEVIQEATPHLAALARPAIEEPPEDAVNYWVGLDFGETTDEEDMEVAASPPEAPENAEAARSAFRALLNLDVSPAPEPKAKAEDSDNGSRGNGRSNSAPLKKRVYEYSDVGMSVSEIARELGLGKGEVRLILNLRKDRGE